MENKPVMKPKTKKNESNTDIIYGVISHQENGYINEPCFGVPLTEVSNQKNVLANFALACGLSIIKKAQLELGDMVVVAGVNPLALNIIVAAKLICAKIICLVPNFNVEDQFRKEFEKVTDRIIGFEYTSSFNAKLNEAIASTNGKIVFFDTTGEPEIVYSMAIRLEQFGTFVFCRQDATKSISLNLRNVHHLKSAKFIYWGNPETLEEALRLKVFLKRVNRLFHWHRLSLPNSLFLIE